MMMCIKYISETDKPREFLSFSLLMISVLLFFTFPLCSVRVIHKALVIIWIRHFSYVGESACSQGV